MRLESFDSKNTLVIDTESTVLIKYWLTIGPVSDEAGGTRSNVLLVLGTRGEERLTIRGQPGEPFHITRNSDTAPAIEGPVGEIKVSGLGGSDNVVSDVLVTRDRRGLSKRLVLGSALLPVTISGGAGNDRVTCRGKAQR